jgi:hypothetical protein
MGATFMIDVYVDNDQLRAVDHEQAVLRQERERRSAIPKKAVGSWLDHQCGASRVKLGEGVQRPLSYYILTFNEDGDLSEASHYPSPQVPWGSVNILKVVHKAIVFFENRLQEQ